MATVSDLIDEVRSTMSANGGSSDQISVLLTPLDASSTSFTAMVNTGQLGVSDGVVEIDSEQIFLSAVDSTTGACQVAPGIGRGWNGTTPQVHALNSKITSSPRLPRLDILRALNNCLLDFYPDLFAVKISETVSDGSTSTFDLDEDCAFVASADYRLAGGELWGRVSALKLIPPEVDGAPVRLQLPYAPAAGITFRFAQAVSPQLYEVESEETAAHNIPLNIDSLLVTAAVAKLTPNSDLDRLDVDTVEQSARSRVVPASAAFTAARFLTGPYAQQLASARRALRSRFPVRITRTF